MQRLENFIAGEFVGPASGAFLDVTEPATGVAYARAPDADERDVASAVEAAERAFPAWSATPAAERSRLLLRLADLIGANLERLARAESIDTGKPIALARALDIPRAAANFRFFATAILHAGTEAFETDRAALSVTLRRPRGVAGLISPWNLPLYLLSWKIAPAIATGNTCVAKPSEVTPATAHALGQLVREAGLPAGVVNIVHGRGGRAGAALVRHPRVGAISFTGSTAVGRWIGEVGGGMLKRLSLELGGKNPFVVFADAPMERALDAACRAAFTNQGQVCLCGSRILVERPAFAPFVEGLTARARALRIGDPLDESTQQGSLVSRAHFDKVSAAVAEAHALGGTIHCGGGPPAAPVNERCRAGAFFLPTVITGLDPACRVEQEEIFGPVVSVTPFDTEEEALRLANGTPYGLAATLWTGDLSRAPRVASGLDAGVVWVNCWMVRDLRTPFGGMKQSGLGREGGAEALRFFTEPRSVTLAVEGP